MGANHREGAIRLLIVAIEEVPGRLKETGQRLHFECGECGERAFFENLNHLTAEEYNRKFGELIALEGQRKGLRGRAVGEL